MITQFLSNGLCAGALYAIMALGFGLIYNSTNIFHFAHGAVYVASAYVFYYLLIVLQLNSTLAFILSLVFSALFGILIDTLIYQPLEKKNISSSAYMISSFGVYLFTVNLIALLFNNETKILNPGIEKTYTFGNVILTRIQIVSFITFIIIALLYFIFRRTKYGKLILAFSNNPKLTEVLGYNTNKIKITLFAAGSILAGIAANLSALDVGIDPNIGMNALLVGAVSVIIGGVKIFEGAIIGGILIGLIQSLVVYQFSAQWMEASTFLLLIIFLLFRPQGLLGMKLRIEEEV
jgi:branched-chain amino acid transport system permease protein